MDMSELQRRVGVAADGVCGPQTRAAILLKLTEGPDTPLDVMDIEDAAEDLGVEQAKIWAVWDVEATASPFIDGRPTILFESHRFSRATGHRFDVSHPHISSRNWNRKLYPGSQAGRWKQLLDAVALDVDAGFASASYGGFQILGENHEICGAPTPWAFAWRQSQTEADQLAAFLLFVKRRGLVQALRTGDWATFAGGYNGTAYQANRYDVRLAEAFARRRAAQ
ncbi:N-acetylmuramidase family protein [Sphingosinithalassobacter portus]|uniref:N-acetylmuramidase family protein n=1 Tax=Stakelama portus TaxID=2676234 RepID=UPI000D6E42C4|nr:N-acetylmuramidase family protein [Sphingosinithalassobacter portus]